MNPKEAGVSRGDFDTIAQLAINDGSAMLNPIELTVEFALMILEKAYE